jgi:hypothetical protein
MNQETLERYRKHYQQHVEKAPNMQVARTLGWVSLAIGLTEIIAPKKIEQTMGLRNGQNTGILRMLGIREIMHGVDILAHRDPTPGLWARVAGDALDGVVLGAAAARARKPAGFMAIAALVLPVVLLDMMFAPRLSRMKEAARSWWR